MAGLKHSIWLILYIVTSFLLSSILIAGNDYIAAAADQVFAGNPIVFAEFFLPLAGMTLAGTFVSFIKSMSGSTYSTRMQQTVRNNLQNHLVNLPYSYFDEKGTGSIMNKLVSDIGEVGRFYSEILPELIVNVITVITITVYLIRMDVWLIVILFASYPIMIIAARHLSGKLKAVAKKRRSSMDDRTEIAYDAISGMVVGRSYNLYPVMKKRIDTVIDEIAAHAARSTRITSMGYVTEHVMTAIPLVACYLFALHETLNGTITTGEMFAFTVLVSRITYPLGRVVFCISDIKEAGVSIGRIKDILREREEESGTEKFSVTEEVPAVSFTDVSFSYDENRKVLNKMTFSVKQGETVAFAGSSGGGKSTIFKLLCGLYRVQSGTYKLFGHDFSRWDLQEARKCFSIVSQNVYLFPDSIFDNVACGKENATEEEVYEACRNANIHDFIMSLPDGYDTLAGERGVRLSGGERQRISIARAFLKDAPILLLDEPTSAVDVETEKLIQDALERVSKGRTVLVIAHRLSTIRESDRIMVVQEGSIAQTGTHDELMGQQGIYANLYGKELGHEEA